MRTPVHSHPAQTPGPPTARLRAPPASPTRPAGRRSSAPAASAPQGPAAPPPAGSLASIHRQLGTHGWSPQDAGLVGRHGCRPGFPLACLASPAQAAAPRRTPAYDYREEQPPPCLGQKPDFSTAYDDFWMDLLHLKEQSSARRPPPRRRRPRQPPLRQKTVPHPPPPPVPGNPPPPFAPPPRPPPAN